MGAGAASCLFDPLAVRHPLLLDNHSAIAGMAAVSASPRLVDLGHNATLAGLVVAANCRRNNIGTQL